MISWTDLSRVPEQAGWGAAGWDAAGPAEEPELPTADDLLVLTSALWESYLDEPDALVPGPAVAPAVAVRAQVGISGGWSGAVLLECSDALGRQAAAAMLGLPAEEVADADLGDAVGELVNVVGGNVKALLPGPSALSVPAVAVGCGPLHVPGARVVAQAGFTWRRQPLAVTVLAAPGAQPPPYAAPAPPASHSVTAAHRPERQEEPRP